MDKAVNVPRYQGVQEKCCYIAQGKVCEDDCAQVICTTVMGHGLRLPFCKVHASLIEGMLKMAKLAFQVFGV